MIRYIIVDDEPLAHELIEGFCNQLPYMELQQHCYDALEALEYLNKHSVDLMFLDLNMPKLKGFDFLKTLPSPPKVIVTTAYQEFALEGFELGVVDYLLKPFSFDRLLKAVNKCMTAINNQSPTSIETPKESDSSAQNNSSSTSFFVKGDKKFHRIDPKELLWVEGYGNYCKLHTSEGMILCQETLSNMQKRLDHQGFMRVHKSFLVPLDKIQTVEGNRIFIGDAEIPIGQTYKAAVNRILLGGG